MSFTTCGSCGHGVHAELLTPGAGFSPAPCPSCPECQRETADAEAEDR
jgi:hypothetical protein